MPYAAGRAGKSRENSRARTRRRRHFRISRELGELGECGIGEIGGMVRMHAGGREQYAGMLLRELDGASRGFDARAGDHQLHDARGPGALHDVPAVGVKAVMRQVDADVDQFHGFRA